MRCRGCRLLARSSCSVANSRRLTVRHPAYSPRGSTVPGRARSRLVSRSTRATTWAPAIPRRTAPDLHAHGRGSAVHDPHRRSPDRQGLGAARGDRGAAQAFAGFSPDGQHVVYHRGVGFGDRLVVAPVDGSGTGIELGPSEPHAGEGINNVAFSPDGTAVYANYDSDKTLGSCRSMARRRSRSPAVSSPSWPGSASRCPERRPSDGPAVPCGTAGPR